MKTIRLAGAAIEPARADDIVEVEPGVFSIVLEGGSYEVRVLASEATVGGYRFRFDVEDSRRWKRSAGAASGNAPAAIVAPMPGKVVRILVAEGDEVSAGQGIIVVEAMKMQNELKCPRDGRVTSMRATPNQSVNAGAVLALIG